MNKGKTDEGRGVSWTGQLWQTRLHMAFLIANIQVVHNCQYSKLYLAILVANLNLYDILTFYYCLLFKKKKTSLDLNIKTLSKLLIAFNLTAIVGL